MKLIIQIAIIFSICWVSTVIESLLPIPFPASVIGMILLFVLLALKVIKVHHIREKSDFLLHNMSFFFIPAGVSILNYLDVLARCIVPLILICVVSTILTFAATAYAIRLTLRLMERRRSRHE